MNKTKMILAGTGGAIGLVVLVMAFLTWRAWSEKTAAIEGDDEEGIDGLETVMSKAQGLSSLTAKHPVFPSAASVTEIDSNRTAVAEWQKEAMKLASSGDRAYAATTPAAFKTFIVSDAKRLMSLPGKVAGLLMKPDFAFGPFKAYIAEGKMPADAELKELQRRWDDVATLAETLAACGVSELTDVQFKDAKAAEPTPEADARGKKQRPNRKANADGKAEAKGPSAYTYVISFATKPAGFVKVMNALTTSERFVAVDGFTFSRTKDAVAEALGGDEKKNEAKQATGRRGRRRAAVVEEKKEDDNAKKSGIVTDPILDDPIAVVMTVTVYDYRSLEEEPETDEASAAAKKGAAK